MARQLDGCRLLLFGPVRSWEGCCGCRELRIATISVSAELAVPLCLRAETSMAGGKARKKTAEGLLLGEGRAKEVLAHDLAYSIALDTSGRQGEAFSSFKLPATQRSGNGAYPAMATCLSPSIFPEVVDWTRVLVLHPTAKLFGVLLKGPLMIVPPLLACLLPFLLSSFTSLLSANSRTRRGPAACVPPGASNAAHCLLALRATVPAPSVKRETFSSPRPSTQVSLGRTHTLEKM